MSTALDNRIDISKALDLRLNHNLSYSKIGKQLGVSAQAVHQRLHKFNKIIDDPEVIDAHDKNTDKLLSGGMFKVLSAALDDKKIKAASTLQLVTSYGVLFDKRRLFNNLATNISVTYDLTSDERKLLQALDAKIINQDNQSLNDNDDKGSEALVSD